MDGWGIFLISFWSAGLMFDGIPGCLSKAATANSSHEMPGDVLGFMSEMKSIFHHSFVLLRPVLAMMMDDTETS